MQRIDNLIQNVINDKGYKICFIFNVNVCAVGIVYCSIILLKQIYVYLLITCILIENWKINKNTLIFAFLCHHVLAEQHLFENCIYNY